jgi:hypothetical protein
MGGGDGTHPSVTDECGVFKPATKQTGLAATVTLSYPGAMKLTHSLLAGLKRRFAARPNPADDGSYRIFTTAYDEIVNASDLPRLLPPQSPSEAESFAEAVKRFESEFSGERITIGAAAAGLVRDLQDSLSKKERARSVVSFLIDHSGSMKGLRMVSALLAVEAAADAMANAGIDNEILGFTTSSWRGGSARLTWRAAGKPRNPGRLCDIRHIVYAAAGRSGAIPWHLRLALRRDLCVRTSTARLCNGPGRGSIPRAGTAGSSAWSTMAPRSTTRPFKPTTTTIF